MYTNCTRKSKAIELLQVITIHCIIYIISVHIQYFRMECIEKYFLSKITGFV